MITIIYKDPYSYLMDRREFKTKEEAIQFLQQLYADYGELDFNVEEA